MTRPASTWCIAASREINDPAGPPAFTLRLHSVPPSPLTPSADFKSLESCPTISRKQESFSGTLRWGNVAATRPRRGREITLRFSRMRCMLNAEHSARTKIPFELPTGSYGELGLIELQSQGLTRIIGKRARTLPTRVIYTRTID